MPFSHCGTLIPRIGDDHVVATGAATWDEDLLLFLDADCVPATDLVAAAATAACATSIVASIVAHRLQLEAQRHRIAHHAAADAVVHAPAAALDGRARRDAERGAPDLGGREP